MSCCARLLTICTLVATMVVTLVRAAEPGPPDLTGIWMPETKRSQGFPRKPPYTAKVQAAIDLNGKSYDENIDDLGRSCLPYGMPQQMLGTAAYPLEIIQTPRRITLISELHMAVRRVFMDGRSIPADVMPTRLGYSIGRWEGATLVVDTTGLAPQAMGNQRRSSQMKITERFTVLEGAGEPKGKGLRVEVKITDPLTYSQPITLNKFYQWGTGEFEMGEYFCNEDLWQQIVSGSDSKIPWR